MKIVLFGASGNIGKRVLAEALTRGHSVTAVVRDPTRVTEEHENLTVVTGNVLDRESVASTAKGHDAAVSAYAPPMETTSTIVEATRTLVAGLHDAGVARFVMVGGAGSLWAAPGVRLEDAPEFPVAWIPIAKAHSEALETLEAEGGELEWTYFSPAALIEAGERTGTFRLGKDDLVADADGNSRISYEDYAIALVDELETPAHVRERFTIGY